ncbi:hypothetical protein A1O1_08364 [Capronia coronata CBS 617.96]|uniref:Uncharacterized protein n=1 Tax=Capronia coronata CBS 617.96 TaxID=1182541 RepID=W9XI77_9EURO|nr:uncharacterized protein A1O1_08364 [Capronia coronata CBS 617.96]EXJ80222.1 hypothetical protein A1O1_08364 [Capronia coronata CBS 617.96]
MAIMERKLGLRSDHLSLTPKKYRGEPDDPHFIPDSPLIDRQTLSEQEEGELKRVCALVLAHVPHSDDASDDPLKYIAAHIQEGRPARQIHSKPERASQSAHVPGTTFANVIQRGTDLKIDTATPSEGSPRYTSTTDNFTPLTSAGLTPGEAGSRLSDTARRSVTSTKKPGSSLRNETLTRTKSRKPSNAGLHRSLEECERPLDATFVGRTLRLVQDSPTGLGSSSNEFMAGTWQSSLSVPDLNKSLPPPPPAPRPDSRDSDDSKQPHVSRLMKTIRKKKSITAESRNVSSGSAPPLPSAEKAKEAATLRPRSRTGATTASAHAPPLPEPPKRRFRLRFFPRLHRPVDLVVN